MKLNFGVTVLDFVFGAMNIRSCGKSSFKYKEIASFYYSSVENGLYKRKCGKVRKQARATGYQNLISHIMADHKSIQKR